MVAQARACKVDFAACAVSARGMNGIPFPDISREIFSIELFGISFALRWYAMGYIIGIFAGWALVRRAVKTARLWPEQRAPLSLAQVDDFLTWLVVGVILGGRLGFVLVYGGDYYFKHPADILKVWQGGMSFHGGFVGVVLATWIFARRQGIAVSALSDLLAFAATPAILLVRIANFINAELWGRPASLPWAVIFPGEAAQYCPGWPSPCARHPSQLYEAGLEGLLLGAVLITLAFGFGWLKKPWHLTGLFILGYGVARFTVEFFRQADARFITFDNPMGYVLHLGAGGVTMGQLLSLPMVAVGLGLLIWARRRR